MESKIGTSLIICLGYFGALTASHHALGLYRARSLGRLADTIHKTNANPYHQQHALARAFKNSISHSNASFKPLVLHKIVAAVAHRTRFNDLVVKKSCIESAIDQFYATPGFLNVLHRLVAGIVNNNTANVNGALAEVNAALEKSKQQKVVVRFSKIIKNHDGKTITEIDLITQDQAGAITWEEIKTRHKLRDNDAPRINVQNCKQRELARRAGAKYTLTIHFTHPDE